MQVVRWFIEAVTSDTDFDGKLINADAIALARAFICVIGARGRQQHEYHYGLPHASTRPEASQV